ncbi:hypothetical protein SapgrDRAFT_3184 [Saprospira grandis DSM 2844]|uniref:Uncharacterized protein n=1 Tax=Saprospira grandis DSM 2844 TaxID=694433 RepID=J0P4Q0_9BACT|nr:hypothetical protein SapgrDRAFT_3184 [Saprospira grandis DSM 2844]
MNWFFCFWGLRIPLVVGATFTPFGHRTGAPIGAGCRSSQVCSALRFGAMHLRLLPLVVELRPKGLVLVCGCAALLQIARPVASLLCGGCAACYLGL